MVAVGGAAAALALALLRLLSFPFWSCALLRVVGRRFDHRAQRRQSTQPRCIGALGRAPLLDSLSALRLLLGFERCALGPREDAKLKPATNKPLHVCLSLQQQTIELGVVPALASVLAAPAPFALNAVSTATRLRVAASVRNFSSAHLAKWADPLSEKAGSKAALI
jgi:hypothetical protein